MGIQDLFNSSYRFSHCYSFLQSARGNKCNTRKYRALCNAFLGLERTGPRGDSHTDLWSWAGFWTVLHRFWFWRAWLRFNFFGLFLRTSSRNWGTNSSIRNPLWWLQLISLFIVNLLCALVSKQCRTSWICNKITYPLLLAAVRIQDQKWVSQWANTPLEQLMSQ